MKIDKKIVIPVILAIVILYAVIDLFGPWHSNVKEFNPKEIAGLETEMWKAYYQKESFHLYRSLVEMLIKQQGFPFIRANYYAYLAAKAALVFKEGKNRQNYELALPYLEKYFNGIKDIGRLSCRPEKVARLELEWWIVHRERLTYGKAALVKAIAEAAAALYSLNSESLTEYAQQRAEAMIIRDEQADKDGVDEKEWQEINIKLIRSYQALEKVMNQKSFSSL
ncbi:MAG TPA: hypothetical protein VMT35_10700 [Ignavibacteriaceae bacterium]|nr:hypothetical protein [Ignavibacteriaceae bacterium]